MARDIDVRESIEDTRSWFNVKRFKIGDASFERPEKALDFKNLTRDQFERAKGRFNFQFAEASKLVREASNVLEVVDSNNDYEIQKFFCKKEWLGKIPRVVNLTFEFSPFELKPKQLSGFLDYHYQYSTLLLTVPNIRTEGTRQETIVDLKNYLKFVDSAYEILDAKNHKPIFVPISLRFGLTDIGKLLEYYFQKGYPNLWFDFEARAIKETTLGKLRFISTRIRENKNRKNIITYYTNIKREVSSHEKIDDSPASDVLASIAGANIIGVNREPRRKPGLGGMLISLENKNRVLDNTTYYYQKVTDRKLQDRSECTLINSVILAKEFQAQRDKLFETHDIGEYISKKKMLKDNPQLLRELIQKSGKESGLGRFFE